jgi:hypothetical protein
MREPSPLIPPFAGKHNEHRDDYHVDKKNGGSGEATFASYGAGSNSTEK